VNDALAAEIVEAIASSPLALARLRELVAATDRTSDSHSPAYTVRTLALELGRSERSIRAAIARRELQAVKRGRGYVISADAVAEWARASVLPTTPHSRYPRRRSGPGPATRALRASR
jgi:excisionase family DNA binding protein